MDQYDYYIAVDWAQSNMAVARMTSRSNQIACFEGPSSVKDLKVYLAQLRGKIILTIEESTASQWLYTELRDEVAQLLICCPYRNRLLSDGPKTDRIDAKKLVQLLRSNLMKPVFHSGDELIRLRKLVSGYNDLVQAGVRLKNQRSAIFRAKGKLPTDGEGTLDEPYERFVLEGVEKRIEAYEAEKKLYEKEFRQAAHQYKAIRLLLSLPGISYVLSAKIVSRVVDPKRFPTTGHFLSYCGLIRLDRISGGKKYGSRAPRYCRVLKSVFKTATATVVGKETSDNPMAEYYRYLVEQKHYPDRLAKHAVSRRIAILALGVLKSQEEFNPNQRRAAQESRESLQAKG